MALIKKAKPADAIEETAEEVAEAPQDELEAAADTDESPEQAAADADTMAALAAVPADPVKAEADGTDALLDMFTAVGIESVDRTLLVGLAGEVQIEDLISELSLVAAALGLARAQQAERNEEDEQLAA
ncbi:MAG TPA: hypothetical protein VJP07_08835 [Dehalococcoidia bacterium]|nr:hypothetical protein [Dehalococcoidia bacterium]